MLGKGGGEIENENKNIIKTIIWPFLSFISIHVTFQNQKELSM